MAVIPQSYVSLDFFSVFLLISVTGVSCFVSPLFVLSLFLLKEFTNSPSLPGGRGLQLLGRLSLVGQSELEEVNSLPNQHHSSDHLPLLARFRFKR